MSIVNEILEYEKQIHDLRKVINYNCEENKDIKELIEWYRKECIERPIAGGDNVVAAEIKRAACTGLTLSMSIYEAYSELKKTLQ